MQISHLEDMVISIKNRLNTELYITTLLRTLCNTTGATRGEGITYPSGAPEFIPGFYWCSCFSIFRWIEVRGKYSFCWYWWNYLPLLLISSVKLWKWMSNKYFRTLIEWICLKVCPIHSSHQATYSFLLVLSYKIAFAHSAISYVEIVNCVGGLCNHIKPVHVLFGYIRDR